MKLLRMCGFATAGVLLASLPGHVLAAGDIQIAKVNPGGNAKTRTLRIETGGGSVAVAVDTTPVVTSSDIRDVSALTERAKVTSGAKPETRDVAALRVRFTPEGTKKMAALSKDWKGKEIAVIVDGKLVATPMLNTNADSGELIFSGNFTPDESRLLASGFSGKGLAPVAEGPKEKQKKR